MALTADDIIKILEAAKNMGLIEPAPKPEPPNDNLEQTTKALITPFDELTDEEVLYWATPHFDLLQAEKESKKQRLEEERELRNG